MLSLGYSSSFNASGRAFTFYALLYNLEGPFKYTHCASYWNDLWAMRGMTKKSSPVGNTLCLKHA